MNRRNVIECLKDILEDETNIRSLTCNKMIKEDEEWNILLV